jgi:hypothetical protein
MARVIACFELKEDAPWEPEVCAAVINAALAERYGPTPLTSLGLTVVPKATTPPEEDR